jgi:uroporphyrinogen decarboxylase
MRKIMDSKTRFLMALKHQKPDRVPFNFWMDRRLMADYEKKISHRHWRVTHFGADVIETFLSLDFPCGPMEERDGTSWLIGQSITDWSKIDELKMPDPREDKVYSLIKADLEEFPDKAVILDTQTPWGIIAGYMRGYEHVYMDMYEFSEQFHKMCRKLIEIQKVAVERACKMGITALYLMEDLATSQGLVMSPAMMEEFIFQYARQLADIARAYKVPFLWHSDGNVADLVPILRDFGVSAVNPLQPNVCDTKAFMQKHGGKVAVYGGIDNCFTIPQSTPQGVRKHVLEQFEILGKPSGGLIFSTHDIPLNTPYENVEIMVKTIKEECRY